MCHPFGGVELEAAHLADVPHERDGVERASAQPFGGACGEGGGAWLNVCGDGVRYGHGRKLAVRSDWKNGVLGSSFVNNFTSRHAP